MNPHDPFIRPTAGRGRQVAQRFVRDVYADHGEVPILKLKNVGTAVKRDGLRAVLVENPN